MEGCAPETSVCNTVCTGEWGQLAAEGPSQASVVQQGPRRVLGPARKGERGAGKGSFWYVFCWKKMLFFEDKLKISYEPLTDLGISNTICSFCAQSTCMYGVRAGCLCPFCYVPASSPFQFGSADTAFHNTTVTANPTQHFSFLTVTDWLRHYRTALICKGNEVHAGEPWCLYFPKHSTFYYAPFFIFLFPKQPSYIPW